MRTIIRKPFFGVLALSLGSLFTTPINADISGTVYRDLAVDGLVLNTYGVKDSNELGVTGITVTAFDNSGSVVGAPASTDANGDWAIVGTSGDLRVEFTTIPSYLESSPANTGSNTTVQFITDGTPEANNVDLGLHEPADYSNTAVPEVILSSWIGGTAAAGGNNPTHYSFPHDRNGQNEDDTFVDDGNGNNIAIKTTAPTTDATASETGSTWGLAYQKNQQRYFSSSVLRRHSELKSGSGTIFVIDKATSPASVIHEFNLNGTNTASGGVIDLGSVCRGGGCENDPGNTGLNNDYDISINANGRSIDLDGMKKVGKISFGDIDIEPQTNNLWAVNLNQKALIKIDVEDSDATNLPLNVDQYLISGLPGVPSCNNGEIRPWGLNFSQGKGYLGIACDAASGGDKGDLVGYVVSFDPNDVATGFVEEVQFPLGFARTVDPKYTFAPWSHDWNDFRNMFGTRFTLPQAIVSDIEFDKKGNMNIALIDRAGMQLGSSNYKPISGTSDLVGNQSRGDVYHACKTAVGFEMEASGACQVHQFTTVVHHSGANQNNFTQGFQQNGEFFEDRAGDSDSEGAMGGLALLKGSEKMVMTQLDPHPSGSVGRTFWTSQGVNWVNPTSGAIEQYYTLYASTDIAEFGKAAGIGDVEILTAPAPLQIGNRVWEDTNKNGIQDPGEPGLNGIEVIVNFPGGLTATTNTATVNGIDGVYLFADGDLTGNADIPRNTDGTITVATTATLADGSSAKLTIQTQGINLAIDSNPNPVTGIFSIRTGSDGENDHTFDIGYIAEVVSIGSIIWNDADKDGVQDAGEAGILNATVTLLDGSGNPVSGVAAQNTGADGLYYFANLPEGDYKVQVTPPAGYVPSVTQTIADNNDGENDSNIATSTGNVHISGLFTLSNNGEPTVDSTISGSDDADNADDNNGNMTVDFAFYTPTVSIGSIIWNDADKDGVQDAGEAGILNATVTLLDGSGNPVSGVAAQNTGADGLYYFANLPEGDYKVQVTPPAGYVPSVTQTIADNNDGENDSNIATSTGNVHISGLFTLSNNGEPTVDSTISGSDDADNADDNNGNMTVDFAFYTPTVKIGDLVWIEDDNDGDPATGTITYPPAGIVVTATASDGTTTYTGTTDANGNYLINVPANDIYTVTVATPAGNIPTQGSTDNSVPDTTAENNKSHDGVGGTTVVVTTVDNLTLDFGFTPPPAGTVQIGDLVWIEDDNDGDSTSGNITPVVGVVVIATASDGTIYTDTTDASGNYLIDVPQNDTYVVTVGTPAGTVATLGSDDDSVPDTTAENNKSHDGAGTTVVVEAEDNLTLDFGFVPTVEIGSLIWYEDDNDGDATTGTVTYPPAGVVVTATASDGTTYTGITGTNGSYSIDVPINGTYIVTIAPPAGFTPTSGSGDSGVPGDSSEDNLSHNGSGTSVTVGTTNNLTVDFGFISNSLLQPPSNEPIPTLSEWALMLLMMMLGFVGYRQGLVRKS